MVDFYGTKAPFNTIYEKGIEDNIGFLPNNVINITFMDEYNAFQIDSTFERFYKLAREGAIKINYSERNNPFSYLGFVQSAENNTIIVHFIRYDIQDGDKIDVVELTITENNCDFTNSTKYIRSVNIHNIRYIIEDIIGGRKLIINNFNDIVKDCKNGTAKLYSPDHGEINCNTFNGGIILRWTDSLSIHHCVINNDLTYNHNTIQLIDNLIDITDEPVNNPKILICTKEEYENILEKDDNTIYIIKSQKTNCDCDCV